MKKMKKIVALLVAAVMCITLSLSVSAAIDDTKTYVLELKFLDVNGDVITVATPGADVYVGAYFYVEDGSAVGIAAFKNSSFMYGIGVPEEVLPELADANGESYVDNVVTGCNDAVAVADGGYVWIDIDIDITAGITTNASAPFSKVKFTLPEAEGEYEFIGDDIYFAVSDEFGMVQSYDLKSATITVEKAASEDPELSVGAAENGDAVVNNGTTYDNAIRVKAKVENYAGASEVGFQFIPSHVKDGDTVLWDKAAKAIIDGAILGTGKVDFNAVLVGIPEILFSNKTITILSRAYAIVDDVLVPGAETSTNVSFE